MATTPSLQTEDSSPPPYDFNSFNLLEGLDKDNSIVSINPGSVSSLTGVTVGTPVLLRAITHGRRGIIGQTICILQTDTSAVYGTIRVNPRVMYSLGIAWGEKVLIERCPNIRYGQYIKLSPVQDCLKFIDGDIDTEFIKPYFEVGYRPVHIGDMFLVKDKSGSKAIELKVKDCEPTPYCLVSPFTQVVHVDPEPREIGDNMLHEFHERRAARPQTGLTEGLVTMVCGRPRSQPVSSSQPQLTYTMAVTPSQPQTTNTRTIMYNRSRVNWHHVRVCVCIVILVAVVVGGIVGGLSANY